VPYDDGSLALPTYYQGVSKFPEVVHLGADGKVLDMIRMEQARASLQPSIVPTGPTDAVAFLRNMSKGIYFIATADGGREWTEPVRLDLVAPNSSIAGTRLPDGRLLLVYNNSQKRRQNLSLAVSSDGGRQWNIVHELEGEEGSFSYPCVVVAHDGTVHVTYTWNRLGIKHVFFNMAWLRAQP
jgi:predicted neuraminidase